MQIIKTENLRFSDKEQQALEMVIILMNGIDKECQDPNLVKLADSVSIGLNEILCNYTEEEY